MLHYDRMDVCHHWYFLDKRFKFQPNVYSEYHDVLIMSINVLTILLF